MWEGPFKISFLRPAVALAPVGVVLLILTVLGELGGLKAVLIWLAVVTSTLWLLARYPADLAAERRQGLILGARRPARNRTPVFLANIVEGVADPLLLLDLKRRVLHANRPARTLLGEGIVGKDIAFYLRQPSALLAIEQAIAEGAMKEQEITLLDPVERPCLMRVTVVGAADGHGDDKADDDEKFQYLIISIVDIAKIKFAEKMRVDFVANASHELRTPLASIIGFIETLQSGAPDEKLRTRFLGIMMAEAMRMQRLIDDLLSLSRIEMGQYVPAEGVVDLGALLKNLVASMELRNGDDKPLINLTVPADLPPARADRDQLLQVFQNLIDNALKYGRPGAAIEIEAKAVLRMPSRNVPGLIVTIFNAGEGIPAHHLPRLTERFYRIDDARSRQLGGTGLGLAIVKHIITRHRGALHIDSKMGVGTTVTVHLPQQH